MSQDKKKNRNNQITINTRVGKVIEKDLGYWIYLIIAQKSAFPATLKGVKSYEYRTELIANRTGSSYFGSVGLAMAGT
ncbi:hypothetical protein ACXM1Q_002095 [Streptococcus sp. 10F2]